MDCFENFNSLELLGVFKISRKKYINVKSHSRGYDTISIRLLGNGHFKTQKEDFLVGRGDLLYLPSTVEYQQFSESETLIAIHFINRSLKKENNAQIIHIDDYGQIEDLIVQMYNTWKSMNVGYQYKCTALLYELLYRSRSLEHVSTIAVTDEGKIKRALDLIHTNYRKVQIDIGDLASACSLSEAYFRKLFKRIHGKSPVQYIIDLKLDFASHLLQSGHYTVSETAMRSGFADAKYFGRLFKSRFCVSPKQYQLRFNSTSSLQSTEQIL